MSEVHTYQTIATTTEAEFKDRGSRFIGYAYPLKQLDDVKKYVHELKELHPKAVHHCYAYRFGYNDNQFRAVDDGEPSGSAGKPILGQITRLQLTDTLIVVVRYFGGVRLGVPGLINAYKTVAQSCLDLNTIIEKNIEILYKLNFEYVYINEVMRIVKQYQLDILQQELLLFCTLYCKIPIAIQTEVISKFEQLRFVEIDLIK